MSLLDFVSDEAHPGHQPGRFAGFGPEFDGMDYDASTGRWALADASSADPDVASALATLSEADQALVTKFESSGGLALTLANAFRLPERLRREGRQILGSVEAAEAEGAGGRGHHASRLAQAPDEEQRKLMEAAAEAFRVAGVDLPADVLDSASPAGRAVLLLQAADLVEEREAVMRNVWSDVEFQCGDAGNAELVGLLEKQFADQLVRSTQARRAAEEDAAARTGGDQTASDADGGRAETSPSAAPRAQELVRDDHVTWEAVERGPEDPIFGIALRHCGDAGELARRMGPEELDKTLFEPRNLGVALDLVGVYLKNYEIDKADLVITRVLPLCRRRGGVWLVKGLDKLSAVRLKQYRAYDALAALKEIESLSPFAPKEGWEFHEILYRNLAWCYSSLDEPGRCLEYTRKSVEVKRECGIPATWFDIWDLGKGHARLGQQSDQLHEMEVGYDLCVRAGEIHRKAEPSDRIMLAKILSNIGEVAMGIGDYHWTKGTEAQAGRWYEKAEPWLLESYELHSGALGPLKPLSGWAAGTVAHCMVRLERHEEALAYLALAWKVECAKDSTTTGSVIELLDRVLAAVQRLGDLGQTSRFLGDLSLGIAGLKARGWHRREPDVFALLLQKAATAHLLVYGASGDGLPEALDLLREAEHYLLVHLADEGVRRGASAPREEHGGAADVPLKQFGPREDAGRLLEQVRGSIDVLSLAVGVGTSGRGASSRFAVEEAPAAARMG